MVKLSFILKYVLSRYCAISIVPSDTIRSHPGNYCLILAWRTGLVLPDQATYEPIFSKSGSRISGSAEFRA
jgi:hypothetical protein